MLKLFNIETKLRNVQSILQNTLIIVVSIRKTQGNARSENVSAHNFCISKNTSVDNTYIEQLSLLTGLRNHVCF